MIGAEERREAARKLRELCDYCDENDFVLDDSDWPGIMSDYIWPEGSGCHTCHDDCRRLADLIDPGPDNPDTDGRKPDRCPDASGIDREALMELAEEMDEVFPDSRDVAVEYIEDYARRIREALGVKS